MKFPMMYEKMATPNKSINAPKNLSTFPLGVKSPNPTVERLVNAKYRLMIKLLEVFASANPYSAKNPGVSYSAYT